MFKNELETNKAAWNKVAKKYFKTCSLPDWGPFAECKENDLLGVIKGRTFLEIGCGSGHSLQYLLRRGARKVYGIDISKTQIGLSREVNKTADKKKIELFVSPMEEKREIKNIDVVFSIYGIGWTRDPQRTFRNIYSYLKLNGRFIWSWEHPMFSKFEYKDNCLLLSNSYFDEKSKFIKSWGGSKGAYIQSRTLSTWFRCLKENGFRVIDFLEPMIEKIPHSAKDNSRYYSETKAKNIPCTMIFICEKMKASRNKVSLIPLIK